MRNRSMAPFSEDVREYETPLSSVFEVTIEDTVLSNPPGRAGNYNKENDIIYDDEF